MLSIYMLEIALATAAPTPKDGVRDGLIRDWGTPVDPDGDCRFQVERGTLQIIVPGKPHVMSVEKGLTNAPRVVREVEGDFTAEVRTSGDFPTDNHSLSEGRWAFYGSGLVIWESEKNYIRFERARMNIPKSGWRCYPNWELRQDGAMTRGWLWEDGTLDATQPAHLRITRKGQEVTGEVSQDGKEWRKLPKLDVKFGRTVRVGIAALQNTAAGYKPVFDGLTITSAGKR